MYRIFKSFAVAFFILLFTSANAVYGIDDSISKAIEKGRAFLLSMQHEDGHWSDPHMPALTALPLWALSATETTSSKAVSNAVAFVLSTQRPDGGFYVPKPGRGGSGLGNYNTSVCLSALFVSGISPTLPMLKARKYIASSQLTGDDTMAGGFGYDKLSRRRYADLSNTSYALDAMRRTEGIEEFRKGERVDVNWDAALKFVESLVAKSGKDAGGAAYNDSNPQAGTVTNKNNKVHLRSYGSMSYAAVLSMCHAQLDKTDPRVRQTLEFCRENWTLDENPRMGSQGLYYYYDILARALSAARVDSIGTHNWKKELAKKLVSLQRPDGSWYNENNRFWESDKVLCTSFAILSLALCK
jgi:squalene-hopene/tetraprenyl-beta-curcumene cyclase